MREREKESERERDLGPVVCGAPLLYYLTWLFPSLVFPLFPFDHFVQIESVCRSVVQPDRVGVGVGVGVGEK